jgi:hypothetical protein
MTEDTQTRASFTTLKAISDRKAQLLKEIRKDSTQITKLRQQLFSKPTALTTRKNKGMRMQGLMSTGAGVLDGLILVWKLYRKFKK